jgi:hypothetical protein
MHTQNSPPRYIFTDLNKRCTKEDKKYIGMHLSVRGTNYKR